MSDQEIKSVLKFEPIKSSHAITETVFACKFQPQLNQEMIKKLEQFENAPELSTDFNIFEPIETQNVIFTALPDGIENPEIHPKRCIGIRLVKLNDDKSPEWVIQATEDTIAIHCLEYTTWKRVYEKAQSYFQTIFSKLESSDFFITTVMLKYVDQFVFNGDITTEYDPNFLFNEKSPFLNPKSLRSGPRWHCHTGWFDEKIDQGENLNQLNIDTALLQNNNHLTTIEHTQNTINLYINIKELLGTPSLKDFMEYMHQENKTVMSNLITSQMAKRISL